MSDILFRFLLTARRRDRSPLGRLFFARERLLEAGFETLVETAAARVAVTAQYERIRQERVTVPASRHESVRFVDAARPNRPDADRFERRSEAFPLRPSLRISDCRSCRGRGSTPCRACAGQGRRRCPRCQGSGTVRSTAGHEPCRSCGGSGAHACGRCGASGRVGCRPCDGEGRMASWKIVVYEWWFESCHADQYPARKLPWGVRGALRRYLKSEEDAVSKLHPTFVERHLGFATDEVLDVVARAEQDRRRLEAKARKTRYQCLHHRTVRSLVPIGSCQVRLHGRADALWLVGRGESAVVLTPRNRPDVRKGLGWLGVGSGGALGYEGLVQAFQLSDVLTTLPLVGELSLAGLAGGLAASATVALVGAHRMFGRRERVQAVGVVHESGQPTPWLACLAFLGSYTGRLCVRDRDYETQIERLRGTLRPPRRSQTLALELADGRKVYLIEVANPDHLSDAQIDLALEALDGLVIVGEADRAADEAPSLETRIRDRLAQCAPSAVRIATATVDRDDTDLEAPLPLEAIRHAFADRFDAELDWQALFERIWRPIEDVLQAPVHQSAGIRRFPARESGPPPSVAQNRVGPQPTSQSESHESVDQDQERPVRPSDGGQKSTDSRRRGLRQELPDRHAGAVHFAT